MLLFCDGECEEDSLPGRTARRLDCDGRGRPCSKGASPPRNLERFRKYRSQDFFCHFRLSDHDHFTERTRSNWDHQSARLLYSSSLSDLPCGIVFLMVAVVVDCHQMSSYHVAAALLYLANYDYSQPWIFGHLWSLSVEEQFYILWPSVLKRWHQHRRAILLGVIAFAPVLHAILYRLKVPEGGDALFPVIADNLAMGCLLAMLAPRIPRINGYLALAMTAAVILVPYYPANTVPRTLLMLFFLRPLFHLSIAGVVLHVIQVPYGFLNWRAVEWLGRISYSLYLWQEPFCPNPNFRPVYAILLALAAASLSYYCVEQPMLKLREKRKRERGTAIARATSTPAA